MGTLVAQMTVGSSDIYHGGIRPTHISWLSVNSRPAWILNPLRFGEVPQQDGGDEEGSQWTTEEVVWVPERWENILEDGLMQIAAHVLVLPDLIEFAEKAAPQMIEPGYADLTKLDPTWLEDARDLVRTGDLPCKIIVTLFHDGRGIADQLPVLSEYGMEVEVC